MKQLLNDTVLFGGTPMRRGDVWNELVRIGVSNGHDCATARRLADRWMQGQNLTAVIRRQGIA